MLRSPSSACSQRPCDLVRKSATKLLTGSCSLFAAKEVALTTTVNTLYSYRKFCASNNSTGQLILPEGLKVLPLYCLVGWCRYSQVHPRLTRG